MPKTSSRRSQNHESHHHQVAEKTGIQIDIPPGDSGDDAPRRPRQRRDVAVFTRSTFWRVVRIHKALQNEERFTAEFLDAEIQVSTRTILRDVQLNQLGMPVEWDPGEHSYVYTRPCDTLPLLCLSRREELVLAVVA
jgi:hypothetical protein